jgi:hypothetical protein
LRFHIDDEVVGGFIDLPLEGVEDGGNAFLGLEEQIVFYF